MRVERENKGKNEGKREGKSYRVLKLVIFCNGSKIRLKIRKKKGLAVGMQPSLKPFSGTTPFQEKGPEAVRR